MTEIKQQTLQSGFPSSSADLPKMVEKRVYQLAQRGLLRRDTRASGYLLPAAKKGPPTLTSNPFHVEALCPVPLGLMPTTGTLSPWALLPVGDPVVVCLVRSTFGVSVRPLPLLIAGCVLPEDHEGEWH